MALGNLFNCSVKMQLSGTFLNIFCSNYFCFNVPDVSAQIHCYKINVGRPYVKFALDTFNLFSLIFCENNCNVINIINIVLSQHQLLHDHVPVPGMHNQVQNLAQ